MNLARLLLLWLFLTCHALSAQAREDHIAHVAVLEDGPDVLSIEQVVAERFTPAPQVLALGYTRSVHWLRLQVDPRGDGGPLVLRMRPSHVDRLTLFEADPQDPGRWRQRTTGERVAWEQREHDSTQYAFRIRPQTPTTYYLRLQTGRSSILQVQALAGAGPACRHVLAALAMAVSHRDAGRAGMGSA